jgi:3-oxoacyl-[acyl-carrier protein] reductase
MDLGLKDKVAVVTGSAGGIGASICSSLCAEGARVIVADIDAGLAEASAAALRATGAQALACAADVTDEKAVAALIELAVERFGTVHILVNNAGFTRDMRITKMGLDDWDAVVDVVLKGAFLCTRAVMPHLSAQGWGRVINISSRAHLGNPGQANYSAAKAGLIGFTRAMALESGRKHITVNAVAPGIIDTEAVRRLPHYAKVREAAEKTTPIPRIGAPEDVAGVVTFLASQQAGYITGEVVHVTGGRY